MAGRTEKSARNIAAGLGSKLLLMLFAFLTKTIFIRLLGAEYNGISWLYINILSVLSLAELGIGEVLNFALYQALKEDDRDRLASLIHLFKKIYLGIALFIAVVGAALVPFLPFIVDSSLPMQETVIYYLLYLADSVCSYLFVYKTTIITADQKNYISTIVETIAKAAMYVLQIIYLLVSKDFLGYLVIQIVCNLGGNFLLSRVAERMYPYIRSRGSRAPDAAVKHMIGENVKATFLYKLSETLLYGTDNILISAMLGTVYVGYYSNYHVLTGYVNSFIYILRSGILASLGNLNAEHTPNASYRTFRSMGLLYGVAAAFCCCCFASCLQAFIPIWIGAEYLLSNVELAAILVVFYFSIVMVPIGMFRATMGLFREVRYILVAAALLNIGLSVVLGNLIGLAGIILATAVAQLLTQYWYEPIILYKKFGEKVSAYFLTQLKYALCTGLCLLVVLFVCRYIPETLLWLFVRVGICAATVAVFELVFNFRTQEFRDLMEKLKQLGCKRKRRSER